MTSEYFQQLLIPEIFSFSGELRIHYFLIVAESKILSIAKVKLIVENFIANPFQNLLAI